MTFRIASLYAPNRNPQRDEFFVSCVPVVDPSVPTFVCGDFNAVFNRATDRRVLFLVVCPRGPGKWKLNISVLKDDGFVSEVKTFWSKWQLRKSCFSSLQS